MERKKSESETAQRPAGYNLLFLNQLIAVSMVAGLGNAMPTGDGIYFILVPLTAPLQSLMACTCSIA
jgi:hypothetical protein